ncbi:Hypothetical protein FKW44_009804 [Caligus rogercresseyi]|uniref:Uncharacterized protein n=1 Tax=Caligus rogercresseyi TaxID=217165 RepID=A0A7T8K942_CALRO|nr:Hypothetical protein FKW44_009804 [Caligus rogercresseyi]
MAQEYNVSARTIGRAVKADRASPFKYKIHLLNEATRVRKARSSWFSNGTQTTLVWL